MSSQSAAASEALSMGLGPPALHVLNKLCVNVC